ncbi:MAG: VCBS repeat-containing protein [Verrucomicrobiota bacterium]
MRGPFGLTAAESVQPVQALHWKSASGLRYAELNPRPTGRAGFTLLDPAGTGIRFTNVLSEAHWITNSMLLNGSGVAAGDIDGDGLTDLYFCNLDAPNVLYRNAGAWKFEDVTEAAGVACPGLLATAAALADLDGDSDLDLIVNSVADGTFIYMNDGKGRFTREAYDPPLNVNKAGMSSALADIDADGDLDLYVTNYRVWSIRDRPNAKLTIENIDGHPRVVAVDGRPATAPDLVGRFTVHPKHGLEEQGEADALFLNDGRGRMTAVSWTDGRFLDEHGNALRSPPYDWGLSVMLRDMNGDRAPDIYVCNDFHSPDRIWLNTGNGRFKALPALAVRSTSIFSMGVDFADINRDGFDDFFVVDMLSPDHQKRQVQIGDMKPVMLPIGEIRNRPQYSRNTLFLNRGDHTYAEIGCFSGVNATEWSWTSAFLDVDLDGYEDLLITTGHEIDAMNADVTQEAEVIKSQTKLTPLEQLKLRKMFDRHVLPNVAFRNRGDLTFERVSELWGFQTVSVAHGMALADLDNDGDIDLAVNNLNDAAGIYRNETSAPRLSVRLKGMTNTAGIGAKITVTGGPVTQSQQMISGGRYLASDDPIRTFATGTSTNPMAIQVVWRNGNRSLVTNAMPNRIYQIAEAETQAADGGLIASESNPVKTAIFKDASDLLRHDHHEDPFDDFERQPLLSYRLSQLGPGVAWHDLDSDEWPDLVIGTGRGGKISVFRNDTKGGFTPISEAPFHRIAGRDQTGIVGFGSTVFVGLSNYEDGSTNGGHIAIIDLNRKISGESILGPSSCTGPLAFADVDLDGDLDLFIGGRSVAGRYPEPAVSLLMRNERGRFVVQQRWSGATSLGLVSGAVFSDLDGDGRVELVLACDWGPVRVLRQNSAGAAGVSEFKEVTDQLGLSAFTGWWNGVTTGDFDRDGRLDIVASNWGLNHKYPASPAQPRRVEYGDFDENGTFDLIESYRNERMQKYVPERGFKAFSAAFPLLQETVTTFAAFGRAGVEDLFRDQLKSARRWEVTTLASMIFLNRGSRFEAIPLPAEAQFAPAFGIAVGDFDSDGFEDLFLSQNLFAVSPDAWRNDAGRGLWLRGNGSGNFESVPGQESGILVYGEQRGCALSDFNGDGRVDLVVTQNGATTKLFQNESSRRGVRIRLRGLPGNPRGIGATLRWQGAGIWGPAREIHAGSGYWSADDPVQVMTLPREATHLWVRWPGGRETKTVIPANAREITVAFE